ncbi:hypothetical protein I302_104025 [Kwoniella bestiolae CBS 10118]|uniref:CBM21 domain-containing protein n=1 Tax=Kwoniella bestiolae CBS 10118 TaxID=1296100 RepID=A0A1B9GA60_9TREE|nr:hypothetical protein I302_02730 [Kwoniella bestiolae CBS 10118]OCF27880.1 hypothetical protein I302_02730 [Kwoniella bestiolae CBS 10118]
MTPSLQNTGPVTGSSHHHSIKPIDPPASQEFYPTPPPSPIISDTNALPPTLDTPPIPLPLATPNVAVPIALSLDTQHHLPHASSLRLETPNSLLATLGGNRVLALDPLASVWDRMPYSASTPIVSTPNVMEEDSVESLVGGQKPQPSMHGLHWAMRKQKSSEHISSIFVSPPTPERMASPTSEDPPSKSIQSSVPSSSSTSNPYAFPNKTVESRSSASSPSGSREASPTASPLLSAKVLPALSSSNGTTIPLQVLPEVRSPPKKTIAMTTDSLQLTAKRGRRPRLFGFTEMMDGGASASASSSAASSAANSPDRTPPVHPRHLDHYSSSSHHSNNNASSSNTSSPANFMPRRHPVRARSEAALMSTIHHIPPRRRENGLKLNFDGIVPLPQPQEVQSASIASPYSSRLIRKKSGEILKSALKYGGPLLPNGTPIHARESIPSPRFESKSCPSTPSCPKYVHFDAQLERVKLFLHDQKPQVVSRDGSPTADTTSEGDEFPFPSTDEEREVKKVLTVSLPNFPTTHPPDSELYLESLFLEDDRKALKGVVVCANISFQKWVAVRFTFDWWQTTSEVTATYKESIKGGKFDRFTFSIKLNDILAKIEEKTLFMAIRYNAEGREIWDSNGGQNYQVLFQKVAPQQPVGLRAARNSISLQPGMGKAVGGRTSQWSVAGGNNDDRLADLRAKLDRLTADEPDRVPVSPNSSRHFSFDFGRRGSTTNSSGSGSSRRGSDNPSPNGSPSRPFSPMDTKASDLPAAGPALAARYDFGASLKTTARRGSTSPVGRPGELPDVKTGLLNYGMNGQKTNSNPHAATEFYSPRFNQASLNTNDYFFSPTSTSTSTMPMPAPVPDVKVQGPSPPPTEDRDTTPTPTTVNAQIRAGSSTYTVPAPKSQAATKAPSPQRPTHALSRNATYPAKFTIGDDSVEVSPNVSPPQLISSSSAESNATDTPSESPRSPPDLSLAKWSPTAKSADSSDDANSLSSYSSFLEQFCWGGNSMTPERRSHSTSSLDNYFQPIEVESGIATPRALATTPQARVVSRIETPSSTTSSSYYSTYSNTPTTKEDLEHVESALGGDRVHVNGHMSPPVMA